MTYQPINLAQRSNKKREFITEIGNPYWMREKKTVIGKKTVYCSMCLTDHEEGMHREGVK
jgi:hypothetical protein